RTGGRTALAARTAPFPVPGRSHLRSGRHLRNDGLLEGSVGAPLPALGAARRVRRRARRRIFLPDPARPGHSPPPPIQERFHSGFRAPGRGDGQSRSPLVLWTVGLRNRSAGGALRLDLPTARRGDASVRLAGADPGRAALSEGLALSELARFLPDAVGSAHVFGHG